jgi:hypothetical protein
MMEFLAVLAAGALLIVTVAWLAVVKLGIGIGIGIGIERPCHLDAEVALGADQHFRGAPDRIRTCDTRFRKPIQSGPNHCDLGI